MAEKIIEYTNGEVTIVWKPGTCIHSAKCVQGLPEVFQPKSKPWIKADQASTSQLKDQVDKCPSGALTYYMNSEGPKATIPVGETKIEVISNGPLIVFGAMEVKKADGTFDVKEARASFCRCGHSENKPYCDGAHKKVGFSPDK